VDVEDLESSRMAKPNALAIFHIPLPEAYDEADEDFEGGEMRWGRQLDGKGSPKFNSGFFTKALLQQRESGPLNTSSTPFDLPEVKLVINGHCHVTDSCQRISGVWMCFGGGSSYSGYSSPGFERGVRVVRAFEWGERIESWRLVDRIGENGMGRPFSRMIDRRELELYAARRN